VRVDDESIAFIHKQVGAPLYGPTRCWWSDQSPDAASWRAWLNRPTAGAGLLTGCWHETGDRPRAVKLGVNYRDLPAEDKKLGTVPARRGGGQVPGDSPRTVGWRKARFFPSLTADSIPKSNVLRVLPRRESPFCDSCDIIHRRWRCAYLRLMA